MSNPMQRRFLCQTRKYIHKRTANCFYFYFLPVKIKTTKDQNKDLQEKIPELHFISKQFKERKGRCRAQFYTQFTWLFVASINKAINTKALISAVKHLQSFLFKKHGCLVLYSTFIYKLHYDRAYLSHLISTTFYFLEFIFTDKRCMLYSTDKSEYRSKLNSLPSNTRKKFCIGNTQVFQIT